MYNEFWVEEGEPSKLVLIKIHHEKLVSWCPVSACTSELCVKVRCVHPMALKMLTSKYKKIPFETPFTYYLRNVRWLDLSCLNPLPVNPLEE